jgi:TolB protein
VSIETPGTVPSAALIWSRDDSRLIYTHIVGEDSQLISVKPDGSDQTVLFATDRVSAPFYLYGSPDDAYVAFLMADKSNGMVLQLADCRQANTIRSIAQGQPNYYSWSPDSQALLLHVGGTSSDAFVGTYHLGDASPTHVESAPADFQTPIWSPSGQARWLYARQRDNTNDLIISDGQTDTTLTSFDDGITFSWSPDGQHVAYAINSTTSMMYDALTIVDTAGNSPHVFFRGNLLAFFWSPDGSKLAYLSGALIEPGPIGRANGVASMRIDQPQRTLEMTWHVLDLKSQQKIDLATFEPADSFLNLVQYFDQYSQSIAVWSPDSRSLVYTGAPLVGKSGVYVLDTTTPSAAPFYVGPGEFAIWSWR